MGSGAPLLVSESFTTFVAADIARRPMMLVLSKSMSLDWYQF